MEPTEIPESEHTAPPVGMAAIRRVWEFIRPYRTQFAIALAIITVRSITQLLTIYYVKDVLSAGDAPGESSLLGGTLGGLTSAVGAGAEQAAGMSREAILARMTAAILKVMGFGTLTVICYAMASYLWDRMAFKAIRDARDRMFAHVNRLSMRFFDRVQSGETTSRLINDTQYLQFLTSSDVREVFAAPTQIICALTMMFSLSWRVTVWGFLVTPLVVLMMGGLGRVVRRTTRKLQESTAGLMGLLSESVQGVRVVRIFGLQKHERTRFGAQNQEIYRNVMRGSRALAAALPGAEWVGYVGFSLVIWVGMYEIVQGRLILAELISLALLMQRAGTYVSKSGRNWARLQELGSVCDRVLGFLKIPVEDEEDEGRPAIDVSQGHVTFDHVSFSYDPDTPILHDVSIEIEPGQMVAVVGESGSGKSTLASLLSRLYEPSDGRVLIDGKPSGEFSRASLRANMGVVLQDSFLFTGTVRSNIWLGDMDAEDEAIREAARVANADEFIEELPDGFETIVGERGATLSGGQRQRVAIARAVLRDPRILILDEATSSLDSEAEKVVQAALNRLMKGRTTLAIAHRLSTIREADRIYVLESGRVVQEGTHDELLASGGTYARLWELQSGKRGSATE